MSKGYCDTRTPFKGEFYYMENISLYIPHVFKNITSDRIVQIFESLRIGKVNYIDLVSKVGKNGYYYSVYVHFDYWYDNVAARNFQKRVLDPKKEARLVYDDPWYWIVLENTDTQRQRIYGKPAQIVTLENENNQLKMEIDALNDKIAILEQKYNN